LSIFVLNFQINLQEISIFFNFQEYTRPSSDTQLYSRKFPVEQGKTRVLQNRKNPEFSSDNFNRKTARIFRFPWICNQNVTYKTFNFQNWYNKTLFKQLNLFGKQRTKLSSLFRICKVNVVVFGAKFILRSPFRIHKFALLKKIQTRFNLTTRNGRFWTASVDFYRIFGTVWDFYSIFDSDDAFFFENIQICSNFRRATDN